MLLYKRCKQLKIINILIILISLFLINNFLYASIIRGQVKSSQTNKVLSGVNISLNNDKGTTTDTNGIFEISLPADKTRNILEFSHIGYNPKKINITSADTSFLNVFLSPVYFNLDSIIVSADPILNLKETGMKVTVDNVIKSSAVSRDIFRVVHSLPGVTNNTSTQARYNVHGGTYDENLVVLNNSKIHSPFHMRQLNNTSIGIFNLEMVDKISFSSGGFYPKYGDALSSALDIKYRQGSRKRIKGQAEINILNFNFLLEGPVFNKKGSWILGMRKSFFGSVMEKVTDKTYWYKYIGYYDIQGQFDYDLTDNHHLRTLFIYSQDKMELNPQENFVPEKINNPEIIDYQSISQGHSNYSNRMFILNLNSVFSEKFSNIFNISYHYDNSDIYNETQNWEKRNPFVQNQSDYFIEYQNSDESTEDLVIQNLDFKQNFKYLINSNWSLEGGAFHYIINYRSKELQYSPEIIKTNLINYPDTTTLSTQNSHHIHSLYKFRTLTYKTGAYINNSYNFIDNFTLNVGGRVDYFDMNKSIAWSPRSSLKYETAGNLAIKLAWGIFHQTPYYKQFKYKYPAKDNTRNQKAMHYVLGISKKFTGNTNFRLDLYNKQYLRLIPVTRTKMGELTYNPDQGENVTGYARGLDLHFHYDSYPVYLWLSYGFLISKEKEDKSDSDWYYRFTDQRHTLSGIVSFKFKNTWDFALKGNYGSGFAYTPYYQRYNESSDIYEWERGSDNAAHYPYYLRMDLQIIKRFNIKGNNLDISLDIFNILDRSNILSYNYEYRSNGKPYREPITLVPRAPSIRFSYSF
jgi:hypothetical protein